MGLVVLDHRRTLGERGRGWEGAEEAAAERQWRVVCLPLCDNVLLVCAASSVRTGCRLA